ASLSTVHDLAAANGNVYLADGVRARWIDFAGVIRTAAGDGYLHSIGDGLAATAAGLNLPTALAMDFGGNLYIADTGTQRVRQVAPKGTMGTIAGTGIAATGGEGSLAAVTPLNTPMGVAVDAFGNLVIADTYNHR